MKVRTKDLQLISGENIVQRGIFAVRRSMMRTGVIRCTAIVLLFAVFSTLLAPEVGAANPLYIVLEIHVEHQGDPIDHADVIKRISDAAVAESVPITFGFGRLFFGRTPAPLQHQLVDHVLDDGHSATLHADLMSTTYDQMLADLKAYSLQLQALGGNPHVASGVCGHVGGPFGWLEAARDAGIRTVAGVVRYCYMSLDPNGAYADQYKSAALDSNCNPDLGGGPGSCHEQVPEVDSDRLQPWHTQKSGDWLRDYGFGTLIVPEFPEYPFTCLAEQSKNPNSCDDDNALHAAADAQALADLIVDASRNLRSGAAGETFKVTWSTNTLPELPYISHFFSELQSDLDAAGLNRGFDGDIVFVTLPYVSGVQ